MQHRIKRLLKGNFIVIAFFVTLAVAYLSLIKITKVSVKIGHIDKVYHFISYFTITICWLLSFYKKPNLKYIIVFCCILFGIIIELLQQAITSYRTADYKDVIANTIGVFLGLIIFNYFFKKIDIK